MNGKTIKLIKKFAKATNQNADELKQHWYKLPHNKRNKFRQIYKDAILY